ncbi:hypothetical protein IFR04_009472 [Cadophora malorum]|uniref:Small secreted protein n=1 Tax=Cadophora malorum TaxID=108018 RepID=A0A8H7W9E3_9HELO|nr:hypothetical protein IFR04_009472 [Cadophora malorum]
MQYSTLLTLALATLSAAAPTQLKARAGVLGTQSYDDLSVSGGVAGDALNEVLAKLPIDTSDFANVDPADIAFLGDVNDIANDAETDAFNVAIEAATGDEKVALQNGKIKNKVLKLEATVLQLQAQAAQGKDTAAKLAEETKKLNNNIALDKAAAGQPSTFLSFDAQAGSGEVAAAPAADDEVVADDGAAADDATVDDATAEDDTEEVEVCTTKRVKKSKL